MRRILALVLTAAACRGESPRTPTTDAAETRFAALVDTLRPAVEKATGLPFREPPRSAIRSREQVRQYLEAKLDEELPPERMHGIETAYRLFGLLADSIQLRPLMLDLLTEQVVGFYDPDSATLFGVSGAPPDQLRIMAAHEMVHALQGQYLPLDSILDQRGSNDRATAAQAILEGQAMVASIGAVTGSDALADPGMWALFREQARNAQQSMPLFAAAPLIVREALIFPYIEGAEFMRWWAGAANADTMPYGPRMPESTEQILHPERYAAGDRPLAVTFEPSDRRVIHEDALGELEIRILGAALSGNDEVPYSVPLGWAGDRYRVLETDAGPALEWLIAFDDARHRDRFAVGIGPKLASMRREGYRARLEPTDIDGRPGLRYQLAPAR
ncbi:MAG TPA: hypothetical protein VFT04_04850 [Gemmatimonadales bacterium]|nr:hypothetical protein [Gemmatimonadales bacterium]